MDGVAASADEATASGSVDGHVVAVSLSGALGMVVVGRVIQLVEVVVVLAGRGR